MSEWHPEVSTGRPVAPRRLEQQSALVHFEPARLLAARARLLEQRGDRVVAGGYPALALRAPVQVRQREDDVALTAPTQSLRREATNPLANVRCGDRGQLAFTTELRNRAFQVTFALHQPSVGRPPALRLRHQVVCGEGRQRRGLGQPGGTAEPSFSERPRTLHEQHFREVRIGNAAFGPRQAEGLAPTAQVPEVGVRARHSALCAPDDAAACSSHVPPPPVGTLNETSLLNMQTSLGSSGAQSLRPPGRAPRAESNVGLLRLPTLPSEEGVHRRLWDPPVATVELVGTLEAPVLAPVADGAWATV